VAKPTSQPAWCSLAWQTLLSPAGLVLAALAAILFLIALLLRRRRDATDHRNELAA
jgi:hypothetical protein